MPLWKLSISKCLTGRTSGSGLRKIMPGTIKYFSYYTKGILESLHPAIGNVWRKLSALAGLTLLLKHLMITGMQDVLQKGLTKVDGAIQHWLYPKG